MSLGGTITMTGDPVDGLAPTLAANDLLLSVPTVATIAAIETWSPFKLPSASLTVTQIAALAEELRRRLASGFDAAVVLQGTDTLEETAYLLECLTGDESTIVLTGAMRGAAAISADGPSNLEAAVRVAADPSSHGRGVLVVFDDEIHSAQFVRKTHTTRLSAFRSPNAAPVGTLIEGVVQYHWRAPRHDALTLQFNADSKPVALLRFAMGMDGRILSTLPDLGFAGLVIEGAGGGHVSAALAPELERLVNAMPVVLSSRCETGPVLEVTYGYPGSEMDLIAKGVLPSGHLDGLKARLLLNLLLATNIHPTELAAEFRRRSH
ncbi:asparaginase [Ensifer adhaerens]|nr:asparaginase [Ensifer adhaerens]